MLALFAVTVPAFTLIGGGGHAFAPLTRALHPRMDLELTPQLIEFGCDESLWKEVRNKQALLDMADNEVQCRKRIDFLKRAVEQGDDGAAPARKAARTMKPFELYGEVPEGIDVAAVEALLAERVEMKKARDYDAADRLQAELVAMGIYVNDRQRTWSKALNPSGGFSLKGPAPEGVDVAAVEALLEKRRAAKKQRQFDTADELQAELTTMGVFINDKEKTWMARKEGRPKTSADAPFTLSGPAPEGVDVSVVEGLIAKRSELKKVRDFEGSDQLQKELLSMGVYVNDRARTWEQAQWVKKQGEDAPPTE